MPAILVISDENEQKLEIALKLQELGYDVLEANNGHEGLDIIESIFPDAVITDLFLPSLDGIGIILQLTKSNPDLPIIIMGKAENAAYLKFAERLGASQVLCKPVNTRELEFAVTQVMLDDYRW